jgi:hypothetical protein
MAVVAHIVGIVCLFTSVTGFMAGDKITEAGRKVRPIALLGSVVYVVWLIAS